ncbi:MAG TPA: hypothetical protein VLK37_07600 [Solirubrobacterales bacterium]|nr:hypothetical protein [Solirubrobacterales bacterium]
MLGTHRLICEDFLSQLGRACKLHGDWPAKVVAAIGAAVDFAVADPARALVVCAEINPVDSLLAVEGGAWRERLAAFLAEGRQQSDRAASLPPVTERALLGGAAFVFARSLTRGEVDELVTLGPQIAELVLLPYLGRAAAAKAVAA